MDDYLTVNEVASICRVSTETVRKWLRAGSLAGVHLGRPWRVSRRVLMEFLEGGDSSGRQEASSSSVGGSSPGSSSPGVAASRSVSASRSLIPRVIGGR